MKQRSTLESASILIFSPVVGMLVANYAFGFLRSVIAIVGSLCGAVVSLLFNIDLSSLWQNMESLETFFALSVLACGFIGGLIWACKLIKAEQGER